MKDIYELIQRLSSREWQALEKFLTLFSTNNAPETKILKLARLLRDSRFAGSAAVYSKEIYKKNNPEAFKQLAFSLKTKVLDCLISTTHSSVSLSMEDREAAVTKLKRKCLQYHYLSQNLGDLEVTRQLLDEIIMTAKKYEQYPILLEHLKLKNWGYHLRNNEKKFNELLKEIHNYEKTYEAYTHTYNYIAKLKIIYEYSGSSWGSIKALYLLKKAIPDVQQKYAHTRSSHILYYLKTLQLDYQLLQKNYYEAERIAHELLEVVQQSKSVLTFQRIGVCYNNLVTCAIHMGKYDEALSLARQALAYFPENNYNYLLSKEWEFYALFYNEKYDEAKDCALTITRAIHKKELGDFRHEKFRYLLACTLFTKGEFTQAYDEIKNNIEIVFSSKSWNFSLRLLKIMALVNLNHREQAFAEIESLRKFIDYNQRKTKLFSSREVCICKFLSLFAQKGFDLKIKHWKLRQMLLLLASDKPGYQWQLLSSELIPFHTWISSKK